MKVILNKDLSTLGEEGDVKEVARGYARNYLFPRGIAFPYNPQTVKIFEARKVEIEAKKAQKRNDALGLKEKIENLELSITMPAGANGRLYGAVTSQTVADELLKHGYNIERKRIDLAGTGIKNVGKYKAVVKLYENSQAEIQVTVLGQEIKTETTQAPERSSRRRREAEKTAAAETSSEPVLSTEAVAAEPAVAEPAPAEAIADKSVEEKQEETPAVNEA